MAATDAFALSLAQAGLTAAYAALVDALVKQGFAEGEAEEYARGEMAAAIAADGTPTLDPAPLEPAPPAPAGEDDGAAVEARGRTRKILELAQSARTTASRDAEWVYQHMGAKPDQIPIQSAPSPGAHAMLVACSRDPRLRAAFYQRWLANAFTLSDYEREQSVHTRSEELTSMLDRLVVVKATAETTP